MLSRTALAALSTLFCCTLSGSAQADIYQYTDKDGAIHFSNTRPSGPARVVVRGEGTRSQTATNSALGGPAGTPQVPATDRDPARYTRYDAWVREAATLYQVPVEFVRSIIRVESDYDQRAVSATGARGLMQLMPATAERMQVKDINDPRENIFGGVRYLRILANMFNGDLVLTIAAYNAGEEAVMRHGGIPPYEQTREYVTKVAKFYRRYRTISDPIEASKGY